MNNKDVEIRVFVYNMESELESEISFDTTMNFDFYDNEFEVVKELAWEIVEEEYVGVDLDDLEIEIKVVRY